MAMRQVVPIAFALGLLVVQAGDSDQSFPPHRVAGNVYYVGSRDLASFLIATPAGHFLINSGAEETVPLIRSAVEKLGFRFSDVKILLEGQAHVDHVGGHALVKKLTGAKVLAMAGDDKVIASGGVGDFQYDSRWTPCPVDRVLHDGETVTLGGVVLTAHLTPGHTKGCTTWTLTTVDHGKTYHVVIVGSANFNPGYRLVNNAKYPQIADDFARTFRVLKALDCDVFLGAHGSYYGMEEKFARLSKGEGNPFVDPQGYRDFLAAREQAFVKELAAQRENPRAGR
jgi:metallo-beta-lactamase class B